MATFEGRFTDVQGLRIAVVGPHARWTPLPTLWDLELSNDAVGHRGLWALSRAHMRAARRDVHGDESCARHVYKRCVRADRHGGGICAQRTGQ